MGPSTDPDAVVDPELRVYGVKGLRVADASIIPILPASHTNAVVFMIGEKASDIIKHHWKTNENSYLYQPEYFGFENNNIRRSFRNSVLHNYKI